MNRRASASPRLERTRVKVCGLTREKDVRLCLELGVDFTGFVFVPGSPRCLDPLEAAALPEGRAARVGVFAGHTVDAVQRVMKAARLDYAQLHGDEDPEYCRAVGAQRVIKTLWPERWAFPQDPFRENLAFADACAFFLLDAGTGGGGSGKEIARQTLRGLSLARPWLLAGGIGPDNARGVLDECAPYGLDCNSALEEAPGRKDAARLRALMAILQPIS